MTISLLAAIVLAGGQSKRMGQDKALVAIQGVPLLQRVCNIAMQCTSIVYVITFRPERYRAIVPSACHLIQEYALPGENTPHGPLIGFAQALETLQLEAKTEWVLLLACDLPYLSGERLQQWANALEHVGDSVALLPRSTKGWEPLCGFYRTSCLASLRAAIERGDRSFQSWLAQEFVQELPLHDAQMLFNCNTPHDLEQVRRER
ncbi:molybdenum cofactor guanylyltransferase [Phormidium sp. FACHB-592]|uniref:Probable molybdenum cofactor guanylyltransferase n=1 Tax=Stenomitos frigidus AS-A4 TaxID=2933935 RepID=A0ABV0KRW5_9CYAN|nr:molybdenum cofactor guanylyltransferase [Phormidium sp. FACHB-592]MBD2074933.1 molybdenum cofactor guanylyltransferase [Phormidium sp. FACHB-592]